MADKGISPRLRSYAPLLNGVCNDGNMDLALGIFAHMKENGVSPSPEMYVSLIHCASVSSELWKLAAEGFVGSVFMEMSRDAFELSRFQIERLKNAMNRNLSTEIAKIVTIDNNTDGVCSACKTKLKAIGLNEIEREKVKKALMMMASEKDIGTGSVKDFCDWLENKEKNEHVKFSCVVDACNIAYHMQNFPGGCFQIKQINAAVEKLKSNGEKVLVVCPERYLNKVIPNSTRFGRLQRKKTVLSEEALQIIEAWKNDGILYKCIDLIDDDLYWMIMTVFYKSGKTFVVSNDRMRDHRLSLLEPTPFARWKKTQQRHFSFERVSPLDIEEPEIILNKIATFTRDVQVSDEGIWHLPILSENESTLNKENNDDFEAEVVGEGWLCIDLPLGIRLSKC
mmetsp:Transcript_14375/g.21322  ORF Transcript_14375/g.21322 Transcript_14375/m.21322 type:complete len:396 (-) Transcript_14375:120-1307(-)